MATEISGGSLRVYRRKRAGLFKLRGKPTALCRARC